MKVIITAQKLKKSVMENFIFCAVNLSRFILITRKSNIKWKLELALFFCGHISTYKIYRKFWEVWTILTKYEYFLRNLEDEAGLQISDHVFDELCGDVLKTNSSKIDEKCFLFYLESFFRSQDIKMFVLIFCSCRKTAWLER